MKLNVFGTEMLIQRKQNSWHAYLLGNEGKRRDVPGLRIPPDLDRSELITYLADIYHENASAKNNDVILLEQD